MGAWCRTRIAAERSTVKKLCACSCAARRLAAPPFFLCVFGFVYIINTPRACSNSAGRNSARVCVHVCVLSFIPITCVFPLVFAWLCTHEITQMVALACIHIAFGVTFVVLCSLAHTQTRVRTRSPHTEHSAQYVFYHMPRNILPSRASLTQHTENVVLRARCIYRASYITSAFTRTP